MLQPLQDPNITDLTPAKLAAASRDDLVQIVAFLWARDQASQKQIQDLQAQNQTLLAQNQTLQAQNLELQKQIVVLQGQVQDLQEKLGLNSKNSSKPPSSDKPWDKHPEKPKSGRKPGGQPGHKGHHRELIPIDKVDEIVVVKPSGCAKCHAPLTGEDPTPQRFQVTEIPPVKPKVIEFQVHGISCPHCHHKTEGELPPGVAESQFGSSVVALIGLLTVRYHLSKRKVVDLLGDVFGLEIGLGSISACEQQVSEALKTPVKELEQYVEQQPTANADETGWRENLKKAWLWTITCSLVTVFKVQAKRNQESAMALLGAFAGILGSDRYGAYNIYQGLRQVCWGHLLRDFLRFSEYEGTAGTIGAQLLELGREIFHHWHKVRDGTISRCDFQKIMEPIKDKVTALLIQGAADGHKKIRGSCKAILRKEALLWVFVYREGVEPTNNAAERAIRPAVIWRKNCYGTHSKEGSRFVERMMTACATLRQQDRNVWQYISAACEAHIRGDKAPSLLPPL